MQDASSWDLDSSEIESITSEDLYANRPNRWKGPKSKWQSRMKEERQLYRLMKRVEGRDLATHLYNAAMLRRRKRKRRRMNSETEGEDEVKREEEEEEEEEDEEDWAPPRIWTAWPTEKEIRLSRRSEGSLEDEIVAAALRLARGRLGKRKCLHGEREDADAETEMKADMAEDDGEKSGSQTPIPSCEKSVPISSPLTDIASSSCSSSSSSAKQPVISADDDLSTHLLTPSVNHILSKLNTTLTLLNNARMACENKPEDNLRRRLERDWSDVLGAASLSGFPDKVIVRASNRCASLFGESFLLRRPHQGNPSSTGHTAATINIVPSTVTPWDEDFDVNSNDDESENLRQRRLASILSTSRHSSPGVKVSASRSRTPTPSATESRRSSRSSVSGLLFFCPVRSCDRAAEGFARRSNMLRHLRSMHPGRSASTD
ncbi:hypothetical protein CP533_6970, partial [Ophiocordyceps camponoti-saundersi (nom. inval.)]